MYAPTAKGTALARSREQPHITAIKPNVAMNSLKIWAGPLLACCDIENSGSPNIKCAIAAPVKPPQICTAM
jgi:hypothetical protein